MVDEPDSVPPPPTKGEGPVPTREDFARLQFRKRLAETLKLELANRERLGHLIEREFVQQHLLALLEGQNIRLLRDLPQTGAARLFALARSSHGTVEEGAKFLRDAISDALTRTRNEAVRNLRQKRKKESDDANRSEAER
ncbi:MAG TPA: hypothetical protein VFU02_17680 [Polyangiaceae bacterium]|nr:hypothetical protein [Polyangiaceae bacterium]